MAQSEKERNAVLKKLQQLQKSDFIGILKAMEEIGRASCRERV